MNFGHPVSIILRQNRKDSPENKTDSCGPHAEQEGTATETQPEQHILLGPNREPTVTQNQRHQGI